MKYIAILLSISALGLMASCTSEVNAQNQMVTQVEWKKLISETHDPQVVDVRTADEFSEGHLKDAVNIDFYAKDFMDRMSVLEKDRPIFIYCHSGGRSAKASDMLFDAGFKQIYDLQGGYSNWEE